MFRFYPMHYTKSKDQLDYIISIPRKRKLWTTGLDSLRCHQHKKAPVTTEKWLGVGWSQKQHILYCSGRAKLPKLCQHDPMQNSFLTTNLVINMILIMQGKKKKTRSFVLFQSTGPSQLQLETKQWTISDISEADEENKQSKSGYRQLCIRE